MRWRGRERSGNIEDRRGRRMGGMALPVGGGIGGLVLLLLFSFMTGQNPGDLVNVGVDPGGSAGIDAGAPPADDPQSEFVSVVLRHTELTWNHIFDTHGQTYQPPRLVLFSEMTPSACGLGQAAMGPFYCPPDQRVFLDMSFFNELAQKFGAPGEFAAAYVIAHEVGHHVQTLTGVSRQVSSARQQAGQREGNALSVRQELQADCYAGVWGHYAARDGMLEPGDVEDGLRAAAAIGDDRLQRESQGRVVPEAFTHGSSEQRVEWLRRGLEGGDIQVCDTFGR